jgi:serine/threonine protein phosphatase PrpC
MGFSLFWHSQKGERTQDNQDCGGLGLRDGAALAILADGASTKRHSGELANELVRTIIDNFVAADTPTTPDTVIGWLSQSHAVLTTRFPLASASYVIVCIDETGTGFSLHAGDCLLGCRVGQSPVAWVLEPHTLANPFGNVVLTAIAEHPARHHLTRGFRAGEFAVPAISTLAPCAGNIVLASDGFWADLDHDGQSRMIDGQAIALAENEDDRSVLVIQPLPGTADHQISEADTGMNDLYVRHAHVT